MEQWCTLMDGIDGLKVQKAPLPTDLGHDEVLVRISRVSLNHRDIKIVCGDFRGRYDLPSEPMVVCSDASGIVVEVGGNATGSSWAKGDRVLTLVRPTHDHGPTRAEHHALGLGFPKPGVLCRYRIFKAASLVRVPDSMSLDEACTLPTAAVITSSSEDKLQRARQLGAQHTINYQTTPSWADEALRLTNGKGVDVIVETGGPATMQQSLKAVAEGGSISAVGVLTGLTEITGQTPIGLSLINRNATLRGINIGPKDRVEEMLDEYCKKRIHPVIDRQFGFDQVKEAFDYVRGGKHFGKVVINVDGT
ncbi:alcohol dehydrogenase [Fusarium albosuccineum]|uniref:Alcohol dehydrogenase n=1 Tax=Fusarium albosuccineum TaxID=1237068 RepID=A0A8H4LM78_9HYPO|nr:alcohol dehydrogenase [Fusarium albosuccineum]